MYQLSLDKQTAEKNKLIQISEKVFNINSVQEEQSFTIQNVSKSKSVIIKFLCPNHFQYRLSVTNATRPIIGSSNSCQFEHESNEDQVKPNLESFSTYNSVEIFANQAIELNLHWSEDEEKDEEVSQHLFQADNNTNNKEQTFQQGGECYNNLIEFLEDTKPVIQLSHNYIDKIIILTAQLENNIPSSPSEHRVHEEEDEDHDFIVQLQKSQKNQKGREENNQSIQSDSTTSMTSFAQNLQTFRVLSGNLQMSIWAKLDKKQVFKQELVINNFFLTRNSPQYSCLFVQKIFECQVQHANKKQHFFDSSSSSSSKAHQQQWMERDKQNQNSSNNEDNIGNENLKSNDHFRLEKKISIPVDRGRAIARVNITPLGSYEGLGNTREQCLKDMFCIPDGNCLCCDEPYSTCFQQHLKITKEEKDIITMHIKKSIEQHEAMVYENNTILYKFDKINKQLKDFSSDIWVLQEDLTQELGVYKTVYFIVGKQSTQNFLTIQQKQHKLKAGGNYKNQSGASQTAANPLSQFYVQRNSTTSLNSQCSPTFKGVSTSYSSIQSNPHINYLKSGKSSDDQNLLSSDNESIENSSSPIRNQGSNRQSINQEDINPNGNNRFSYDTNAPSSSSQINFSEMNTPTNQKKSSNIITPRQVITQEKINLKTSNTNNMYSTDTSQPQQQNQNNKNSPSQIADSNRVKETASTFQTIYEIGGEEENSFRDGNLLLRKQQYVLDFPSVVYGNTTDDEKHRQTAPVYDMNYDRSVHTNMFKSLVPTKDSSDLNCFESEDFRKSKLKLPRSKKEGSITTEQKNIKHMILSDDSLYFITATECGLVTVWNISTQEKTVFDDHQKSTNRSINFLKSMNDNDRFMTGGSDKTLKIFSLKKMQLIHSIEVKRKMVHCAAILPDLDMIAVGGLNISKLATLGKVTKRRNIKFYCLSNYKYLKKFKIPSTENEITHLEYCQSKYNTCYITTTAAADEEERKTKSNVTLLPSNQQYRESASGAKTESSDNDGIDDRQSVKSLSTKSVCSPKLSKINSSILACVVQGSYGSRLIFIQLNKKGKMEIILNCEMLTIGIYKVHRFFFSHSLQKLICMPKPNEKKGQTVNYFYEIDIASTNKIESIKHTPSFEKPLIDLSLCQDQNIIIAIPSENYFYLYDVKDQAIIDRSNTLDFLPKQAFVSPLNFAAVHLESGNGKINIFKLPSQTTS